MAVNCEAIEELADVFDRHDIVFRKIEGVLWVFSHNRAVGRARIESVDANAIRSLTRPDMNRWAPPAHRSWPCL